MRKYISKYSKIFNEAGWIMGSNLLGAFFSSVFVFFTAYKLGIKDYGTIAVVSSIVLLVQEILSFRTWEVIINVGYKFKEKKADFFKIYKSFLYLDFLTVALSISILAIGSYIWTGINENENSLTSLILLYAFVGLITFNKNTSLALLRVFKKYKEIALLNISTNLLKMLLGFLFLTVSSTIESYIYLLIIVSFFSMILYFRLVKNTLGIDRGMIKSNKISIYEIIGNFKKFKSLMLTSYWVSTLKTISTRLLVILMSVWFSKEIIGAFKFTRDILMVINLAFTDPLYNMVYPRMAQIKKNMKFTGLKKIITFSFIFSLIVSLGYFLTLITIGELLINSFFEEYSISISLLKVMSVEIFFYLQLSWITPLLMTLEINRVNIMSRLINMISLVILVYMTKDFLGIFSVQFSIIIALMIQCIYLINHLNVYKNKKKFIRR